MMLNFLFSTFEGGFLLGFLVWCVAVAYAITPSLRHAYLLGVKHGRSTRDCQACREAMAEEYLKGSSI